MISARSRCPFTPNQWQELEHQALIFKYMVSGVPIPPELIYSVKRSLDSSSLPSHLFPQQPSGWGCYQVGFGRKADPEPGRCRRTDGKKWRCSKEAYPDSRYCERHMHRGKNRSKKPIEVTSKTTATTSTLSPSFSPINNRNPFPYSHHPSTASGLSVQTANDGISAHHFMDFGHGISYAQADNDYRYVHGTREGVDERSFFPEALRSVTTADSYQPLTLSSYKSYGDSHSQEQPHCFVLGTDIKSARPMKVEKAEEAQKPVHQLLGDWLSRNTGSCLDLASNSDS